MKCETMGQKSVRTSWPMQFQYRSLSFVALHIGCDRIQDLLYGLSLGRKWNTPYYCGAREVG